MPDPAVRAAMWEREGNSHYEAGRRGVDLRLRTRFFEVRTKAADRGNGGLRYFLSHNRGRFALSSDGDVY